MATKPSNPGPGRGDGPVSDRWVEGDKPVLPGRNSGNETGQGKGSGKSGEVKPQPFGGRFGVIRRDLGTGRRPVKGN